MALQGKDTHTAPFVLLIYTPCAGKKWQQALQNSNVKSDIFSPLIPKRIALKQPDNNPDVIVWLSQNAVKFGKKLQTCETDHIAIGPATASALDVKAHTPPAPYNTKSLTNYLTQQTYRKICIIGPDTTSIKAFETSLPGRSCKLVATYANRATKMLAPNHSFTHAVIGSFMQILTLQSNSPELFNRIKHAHCLCHTKKVRDFLRDHEFTQISIIQAHDIHKSLDLIKMSLHQTSSSIA